MLLTLYRFKPPKMTAVAVVVIVIKINGVITLVTLLVYL